MVAKTLFGFEDILAREIADLGGGRIEQGVRSVEFYGDTGFMYKANLCLRTALKILKPVASFKVRNEADLYHGVYQQPWQDYFSPNQTFAIHATLKTDVFNHSLFVAQKTKDAIADKFRKLGKNRPSVDTQNPDIRISIHISDSRATISLDSSGASLHHRGYRTITNIAPINEVLAAGILKLSGWNGDKHFMDPMCGSGTFLVEAAMMACNVPVQINREHFSFINWPDYDPELFDKIRESALNRSREFHHTIIGLDKAPSAVRKSAENIENSGLGEFIKVNQDDFFKTVKQVEGDLHMVFNPPYGERLNVHMPSFYKKIGDTLKQGYPGTDTWLITANLESIKHVGLRPSRKIKLFNGKLESRLLNFKIYEGSKKAKYKNGERSNLKAGFN